MSKKITFEEVQQRIESVRDDVSLCEEGFFGYKKKSKAYDHIEKDYFWAVPYKIFKEGVSHPNRRTDKRKKTNLERYGSEYAINNEQIRKKRDQTNMERYGASTPLSIQEKREQGKITSLQKYGAENPAQSDIIKRKKINTIKNRYGVEHQMHSDEVKNKIKETNIERYGVENSMHSKDFVEKIKKTNMEKYGAEYQIASEHTKNKSKQTTYEKHGVNHQSKIPEVKQKISEKNKQKAQQIKDNSRKTFLKKYGVETPLLLKENKEKAFRSLKDNSKYWVKETMIPISDWLKVKEHPKPSITTLQRYLNSYLSNQEEYKYFSEQFLSNFINQYRNNKTSLEAFTEEFLNEKFYNKKPFCISKDCRPDFKLSDDVYLNVDGLYWHSTAIESNKWYHWNLRKEFEEHGLKLLQFREDEIYNKTDIVKSIINHSVGLSSCSISARDCFIFYIDQKEASNFLDKNHLMGSIKAKHVGLYKKNTNDLKALLSYKIKKGNILNIERFCTEKNVNVNGGFGKLLSFAEKKNKSKINKVHCWVDLRYGYGYALKDIHNFDYDHDSLGWRWTDFYNTYNRLACKANMDSRKLTQKQHAEELEWFKIYDAGQRLYVKNV